MGAPKKKILIIDDEKPVRELIRSVLTEEEYDFFEAENGKRGLEVLSQQEVDIILLDVLMPEMSGLEFLPKLKELSLEKKIPVILVTSQLNHGVFTNALDFDCFSYLVKPFDHDKLKQTVKSALDV